MLLLNCIACSEAECTWHQAFLQNKIDCCCLPLWMYIFFHTNHCLLSHSFVLPAAHSTAHWLPCVRPLDARPQLADGCRQRRLYSERSDMTSRPLSNYGKWREWLLFAAEVTAIKGWGPPTQMADSRHIHFFPSLFFFFSLARHARHRRDAENKVRGDLCAMQLSNSTGALLCGPAEEGQDSWNTNKHLCSLLIKSDCWYVLCKKVANVVTVEKKVGCNSCFGSIFKWLINMLFLN